MRHWRLQPRVLVAIGGILILGQGFVISGCELLVGGYGISSDAGGSGDDGTSGADQAAGGGGQGGGGGVAGGGGAAGGGAGGGGIAADSAADTGGGSGCSRAQALLAQYFSSQCQPCVDQNCCAQEQACAQDPQCNAYVGCAIQCEQSNGCGAAAANCITGCQQTSSAGSNAFFGQGGDGLCARRSIVIAKIGAS